MLNTTVLYFRGGRLPVAGSFYRDYRGGRWDFRFWLFFDRFFGFCVKRLRFFGFVVRCGLRIFRFLAFGFRFSYKIRAVFRFYYSMWFVFGFRFWPNSLPVFGFWMIFSSVLRFLTYPNVPLIILKDWEQYKCF